MERYDHYSTFHIYLPTSQILFCFKFQTAKRRLDIKEDIENHTTCQGVKIEVPADIMLSFIGAAAQCLAFEDEFVRWNIKYIILKFWERFCIVVLQAVHKL